ncbi:MAG: helix-turn-helix domain-containing protein [Gammaproteobacteria bacterium]
MDTKTALSALAALAQDSRLAACRLLVTAGPDGLSAGAIARQLGIPANTLSAHLNVLSHAGLVEARRAGRSMIYCVRYDNMRGLIDYLLEDCCQNRPEICQPNPLTANCCNDPEQKSA